MKNPKICKYYTKNIPSRDFSHKAYSLFKKNKSDKTCTKSAKNRRPRLVLNYDRQNIPIDIQ